MVDAQGYPNTKAEIVVRMEAARRALLATLGAQELAALVAPGPDGGWSVKDHIAHIAAWERYLAAMLTGDDRWTEMGLTGAPTQVEEWQINKAIYEHNVDLSLAQVYARWDAAHRTVLDALAGLTDADLLLPFAHYVPDATGDGATDPIYGWINGNTWGHYEEHAGWIAEQLAQADAAQVADTGGAYGPSVVADFIAANDAARTEIMTLLAGLDEAALSAPRGPDGWAIKDHLLHLAAWERGVAALLGGHDRSNAMGLTDAQTEMVDNADEINALLFEAGRMRTAQAALAEFEAAHLAMQAALATLTDADLQRPYAEFLPDADDTDLGPPIAEVISGNAWAHYIEHLEWIEDALGE